jgi:serine phosphatase RsbU (regulator of sigma subunit)
VSPPPGARVLHRLGGPVRRRLFLKFAVATIGIGLVANGLVLSAYRQYRESQAIGEVAGEIATVASRVGRPLVGYLAREDLKPARDLLAVFAAFPYVICADATSAGTEAVASWPVIGCTRIKRAGEDVRITLPAAGAPAELLVRFDRDRALEDVRREFGILGTLAGIGGLAILLPALLTFLLIINRPLARMLAAIEEFKLHDIPRRVDYRSEDEIGRVVQSYNLMLDREVQRVTEVRNAHQAILESVSYASRIQRGLLPPPSRLETLFAEVAVLWEPRDVVGGDFYWVSSAGPRTTIAVVDCTGHGVPGAFLTLVAVSTLERIVGERADLAPAEILRRLNDLIRRLLNQDVAEPASNDGMDAAICQIDPSARRMVFAGARLSLLLDQAGRLTRIQGDRISIGYADSPASPRFRETTIPLDETTRLFLVTDGITDQPGGPKGLAFGFRRLVRGLTEHQGAPLARALEGVASSLAAYAAREPRRDDLTLIGFRPKLD